MAKELGHPEGRPTPLLSLVWKLQQSADELLEAKNGVGLSQTRIMAVLDKSVPHSQNYVAVELKQTESNVSRQLKVMKRAGLVNITKNKKDSRQRDVSLTPKGYRMYLKAEQILKHHERGLLSTLSRNHAHDFQDQVNNLVNLL